jgi:hypothetical protein
MGIASWSPARRSTDSDRVIEHARERRWVFWGKKEKGGWLGNKKEVSAEGHGLTTDQPA